MTTLTNRGRPFSFAVFNDHVAVPAEADEIFEPIRLFGSSKISKAFEMVNFQRLAYLRFSYAAFLASVIVPRPSAPSLSFPVRSIVRSGASAPGMAIFATPVMRFPVTETSSVAIESSLCFASALVNHLVRLSLKSLAAPIAGDHDRGNPGWRLLSGAGTLVFPHALVTTKVCLSDRVGGTKEYLAASGTGDFCLSVFRAIFTAQIFRLPFVGAFQCAKLVLGARQPIRLAPDFLSALLARHYLRRCSGDSSTCAATGMNLGSFYKCWLTVKLFMAYLACDFHSFIIGENGENVKRVGSGTTLAVALKFGRRAIGIDLDPRNAILVKQRIEQSQPMLLSEVTQ